MLRVKRLSVLGRLSLSVVVALALVLFGCVVLLLLLWQNNGHLKDATDLAAESLFCEAVVERASAWAETPRTLNDLKSLVPDRELGDGYHDIRYYVSVGPQYLGSAPPLGSRGRGPSCQEIEKSLGTSLSIRLITTPDGDFYYVAEFVDPLGYENGIMRRAVMDIVYDKSAVFRRIARAEIWFVIGLSVVCLLVIALFTILIEWSNRGALQTINDALKRFGEGERGRRIDVAATGFDEFARLAGAVNGLLDQAQWQIDALGRASRQVEHDIRERLGLAEKLLAGDAPTSLDVCSAGTAVRNALLVAEDTLKVLRGEGRRVTPIDLSGLLVILLDEYRDTFSGRDLVLSVAVVEGVKVMGEPGAVRALVGNLFRNVDRHGVPGAVMVRLDRPAADTFRLCIENVCALATARAPRPDDHGTGLENAQTLAHAFGWKLVTRISEGVFSAQLRGAAIADAEDTLAVC